MPIEKFRVPNRIDVDKLERLKELFPEAYREGRWNIAVLSELITAYGDEIEESSEEYYGLNWNGKKEAKLLAFLPPQGTLKLRPGEGVNEDTTQNFLIEGDNLEVLRLLRKSYKEKFKLIYIDPPYNTGHDFIYKDDFREPLQKYLLKTNQADEEGLLTSNPKSGGRYHANWLSMMYPRLKLARDVLSDEGFICVSIGVEEYHNLRHLMDEIFGEDNHRNTIAVRRYDKNLSRQFMDQGLTSLSVGFEFIVVYSKSPKGKLNPIFKETSEERKNKGYWKGFWNSADRPTMRYPLLGVTPTEGQWKWSKEVAEEAVNNYIEYEKNFSKNMSLEEYWEKTGRTKRFIRRNLNGKGKNLGVEHWVPPSEGTLRSSNWTDILASESLKEWDIPFDAPKNVELIKKIIEMTTDEGDLILDFFAGSGTTGHAVLELNEETEINRNFILVQLPEIVDQGEYRTISDITKARLRKSIEKLSKDNNSKTKDRGFKVLYLADSNLKRFSKYEGDNIEELENLFDYSPIKKNTNEIDFVIEMMLHQGFPLDSKIYEAQKLAAKSLWVVEHSDVPFSLIISLAEQLSDEDINYLTSNFSGATFICMDSALTDKSKLLLSELMKVLTI